MNRIAAKDVVTNDSQVPVEKGIEILVVDDKPNIISQISEIFSRSELGHKKVL